MSYYKDITTVNASTAFQFQTPAVGVQNYIRCKNGELAGWEYYRTDSDGNVMVKIYNKTNGVAVQVATLYSIPGRDIFCGLFSSGCIPSKSVLSSNCIFYRINYT